MVEVTKHTKHGKDVWKVSFHGGCNFFDTETAAVAYALAVEAMILESERIDAMGEGRT